MYTLKRTKKFERSGLIDIVYSRMFVIRISRGES